MAFICIFTCIPKRFVLTFVGILQTETFPAMQTCHTRNIEEERHSKNLSKHTSLRYYTIYNIAEKYSLYIYIYKRERENYNLYKANVFNVTLLRRKHLTHTTRRDIINKDARRCSFHKIVIVSEGFS